MVEIVQSKAFKDALNIFKQPIDKQPKSRQEYLDLLDKYRLEINEEEKEYFDDLYESYI